jgi:hypothetical protein
MIFWSKIPPNAQMTGATDSLCNGLHNIVRIDGLMAGILLSRTPPSFRD